MSNTADCETSIVTTHKPQATGTFVTRPRLVSIGSKMAFRVPKDQKFSKLSTGFRNNAQPALHRAFCAIQMSHAIFATFASTFGATLVMRSWTKWKAHQLLKPAKLTAPACTGLKQQGRLRPQLMQTTSVDLLNKQ